MKLHLRKNPALLASTLAAALCAMSSYANLAGNGTQAMDRVLPAGPSGDMSLDDAPVAGMASPKAGLAKSETQISPKQTARLQGLSTETIEKALDERELSARNRSVLEAELLRRVPGGQKARLQMVPSATIEKLLSDGRLSSGRQLSLHERQTLEAELSRRVLRFKLGGFPREIEIHCSSDSSLELARRVDLESLICSNANVVGKTEVSEADVLKALEQVRNDLTSGIADKDHLYFLNSLNVRNVPPSSSARAGALVVDFDEGCYGAVDIKVKDHNGYRWFSDEQITKRYFSEIKRGERFDYAKLRAALFNINSQPDLTVDADIGALRTNNWWAADVKLEVEEHFPLHALFEINNYGMEEVEEWQTALTLQYLNLTKHDDVLTFSPSISFGGELFSVAGSYMLPHYWWRGGNTTVYGGYSRLDVDNIVPRLDLEGTGWFAGLQHSEYLLDDDKRLLALSLGLLWRTTEDQYTAYSYKLKKREASILPISLALSYTGKKRDFLGGRNFATAQFLFNVMNSGDDLDEMWTGADKNYWIFRWQTARLQPLQALWGDIDALHQWLLFLRLEGQYTTDTLIPVEKLSLGGYNCMRGYRTRGYLGDYGVYGTVELRTPILVNLFSSMYGAWKVEDQYDRFQVLGFVDWGWTAFNDLPSSYDDNEFIYSAGFGARLSVTEYMQLKCDLAFPLRDTDWADDDDMEVYVSAQFQF